MSDKIATLKPLIAEHAFGVGQLSWFDYIYVTKTQIITYWLGKGKSLLLAKTLIIMTILESLNDFVQCIMYNSLENGWLNIEPYS